MIATRKPGPLRRTGHALGVIAICLFAAFPIYWMGAIGALKRDALFHFPPALIPTAIDLANFTTLLTDPRFLTWIVNSLKIAAGTAFFSLLIGVPGGFALSRFRYRGKQTFAVMVLSTKMIPTIVLIIPMFKAFVYFRMLDSHAALIVGNVAFALPIVVWMMRSVFDSIPHEIEEAALIDGANWFQVFWRVTGPLALPGLVATGIYAFIEGWDEYLLARTLLSSEDNWPGSVGIASFIGNYGVDYTSLMAAAALFSIPPVVLFMFVQRSFVAGLGAGAVKG
ncbi:MAG: carbohydrate ABC transporter permease [Proteobacteria bacterium]|jgi:multiple sugar transport system permease protein|nr:carbohydrate ABC transporter permease [Pseudomonadota bacterium]